MTDSIEENNEQGVIVIQKVESAPLEFNLNDEKPNKSSCRFYDPYDGLSEEERAQLEYEINLSLDAIENDRFIA